MQLYDKLKPLLEEYYRLNDEWRAREPWRAVFGPGWEVRQNELKERRKELQRRIISLTQKDRTLVN
jgi:hypothetical protein